MQMPSAADAHLALTGYAVRRHDAIPADISLPLPPYATPYAMPRRHGAAFYAVSIVTLMPSSADAAAMPLPPLSMP